MTVAVNAYDGRDSIIMNVPNAFIQTHIPAKRDGKRIIMKIRGKLVEWLVNIEPTRYALFVVIKKNHKVLYLNIIWAIYSMLEALLLWYRKFRSELEGVGFKFNGYDPCVANRTSNKSQLTIRFHVDDVLTSFLDPKVNENFGAWADKNMEN